MVQSDTIQSPNEHRFFESYLWEEKCHAVVQPSTIKQSKGLLLVNSRQLNHCHDEKMPYANCIGFDMPCQRRRQGVVVALLRIFRLAYYYYVNHIYAKQ